MIMSLIGSTSNETDVHEFHLSKSTINYNTTEQAIQITMNLFIDDLELALKEYGADSLQICTRYESDDAEDYILQYINDRLIIIIDDKPVEVSFIGKEQSDDLEAVWCYFEVLDIGSIRQLSVQNTIMTDLFDDQKNITSIRKDKHRIEDILFSTKKTTENIPFDD